MLKSTKKEINKLLFEMALGTLKPKIPITKRVWPGKKPATVNMLMGNKMSLLLSTFQKENKKELQRIDFEPTGHFSFAQEFRAGLILGYLTTTKIGNKRYFQITSLGKKVGKMLEYDEDIAKRTIPVPIKVNPYYWAHFVTHNSMAKLT